MAHIQRLLSEMAENRRHYAENYKDLQRSLFLYKTGLSNVNGKIKSTAESYATLIQPEQLEQTQDVTLGLMHRRAS